MLMIMDSQGQKREDGFTNDYRAGSIHPQSPFAAYSENGIMITGQTSAVSIHGAVWLLGSLAAGIFGGTKKQIRPW